VHETDGSWQAHDFALRADAVQYADDVAAEGDEDRSPITAVFDDTFAVVHRGTPCYSTRV
jgi:hypothetical protein